MDETVVETVIETISNGRGKTKLINVRDPKTRKKHSFDDKPGSIEYFPKNEIKEIWYNQGIIHRLYYPAIIHSNKRTGKIVCEQWFIDGINIDGEINNIKVLLNLNKDYKQWTDEERLIFKMFFK